MNILKEFAKIFIKSKLDDEKRKLKDKLQKQIITTTSTSVVARNVAYLGIVDKLDGKGIAEINKCQVVNDVKTKNIVYMKMQSIIILCIFIIIHLLFSILSCSF